MKSSRSGFSIARSLVFAGVLLVAAVSARAQQLSIDTARSKMTVRVYKTGLLSAFGHDHEITAPIEAGTVDPTARQVRLRTRVEALQVRDPEISEKDREEIRKTMLSAQVLDAEHYPEISFTATAAQPAGAAAWTVQGELTLHGQTHPVTVRVHEESGRYEGAALIRQSEFGIRPVKVAGGTVRVKDEVRVEFTVQLVH